MDSNIVMFPWGIVCDVADYRPLVAYSVLCLQRPSRQCHVEVDIVSCGTIRGEVSNSVIGRKVSQAQISMDSG